MAVQSSTALCPALIVDADANAQQRMQRVIQALDGANAATMAVASIPAAQDALESGQYAMVLVDPGPFGCSGIGFLSWMREHCPKVACVVVSSWGRKERVLAALKAGAAGYLLKERDDAELGRSLASVCAGGAPIDPAVARCMLDELKVEGSSTAHAHGTSTASQLSEREAEILNLVSRGCSNREIAEMTSLSRFTVESHIKKVYRKLSVGSRTAAVFEAKAMGLLQ